MEKSNRRSFLINAARTTCALALGGMVYRVAGSYLNDENPGPATRHAWQIDTEKCTACGKCQTLCVRTPSAVKAVNDQKKCSFCVVCYGHISNKNIASDKIMTEGKRVCPVDAVIRKEYSGGKDGYYTYEIDDNKCDACCKCVEHCTKKGTRSMFLIIRPDLCMNCNSCNIAVNCPEKAVDKVFIGPEDDFKGIWELEKDDPSLKKMDLSGRQG
jgi:Na+-translocating ferredoxin:NAD+ oxidoreductase subunit B